MSKEKIYDRRNFLENAIMSLGAAELAMLGYWKDQLVESHVIIVINLILAKESTTYFIKPNYTQRLHFL